jgi:chromosome segregation ATPase
VAGELATARREFDAQLASLGKADDETAQLKKTAEAAKAELQQERQRTAAVAGELATARREFDAKLASLGKAADETAQLKKTVEAATAELQQERQRTAALTQKLDMAQRAIEARAADSTPKDQAVQTKPVVESTAQEQLTGSTTKGDVETGRLTTRATALIAEGNIGAARSVLERAVEMGSAKASFALAETYDPRILSGWRTYGTRGDVSKAREFYARAVAGGIEAAKDRLKSLPQ